MVWAAKVVRANWKVACEAFMEAWHSAATHRQIVDFTGDANTKYNIYGDHVNLALTPFAVPSPYRGGEPLTEHALLQQMLKYNGRAATADLRIELAPGQTARQGLAAVNRLRLGEARPARLQRNQRCRDGGCHHLQCLPQLRAVGRVSSQYAVSLEALAGPTPYLDGGAASDARADRKGKAAFGCHADARSGRTVGVRAGNERAGIGHRSRFSQSTENPGRTDRLEERQGAARKLSGDTHPAVSTDLG